MTTHKIENDACVFCKRSTAFNSGDGLFFNRIPTDDGWACAECAGFECDECEQQIYLDTEVRVDYQKDGVFHYGNYHEDCYSFLKHGERQW